MNNKRRWFLSAVTSLSVWMTAGHARHTVGATGSDIRFQQQHHILHWTAAPFSVMWRQRTCLQCSCACLSTSLHHILRVLLAPSPPTYLMGLWSVPENRDPRPQPCHNRIRVTMKRIITRVQCSFLHLCNISHVSDTVQSWSVGCIKDIDGMLPLTFITLRYCHW